MLTLYYRPTCPFCQRVLARAEELDVKFNLKNIPEDIALVDELIEKGGKKQVPFFVDSEKDVMMYESLDIIAYLREHYSEGTASVESGLHVHKDGEVCKSCQ